MNPATRPPVWACPDWGPEHNWHDCDDCMDAYELMIAKAQEWDEEPALHDAAAPGQDAGA